MSVATMSSLEGGSSVPGSATAASMSTPQFAPVHPPRRSHEANTATTRTMKTGSWGEERRSMALNISPGGERSNDVGRSDGLTAGRSEVPPDVDDGICDFREAHRTPEDCCESRSPVERRRLCGIEQDRSMLQEGISAPDLGRADELPTPVKDLAAHR